MSPLRSLPLIPCLALLLLALLSSSPFSSAQPLAPFPRIDFTQLTVASITSNGTCTDVFPTVYNCTLPTRLSIRLGGNVPLNLSATYLIFVFTAGSLDFSDWAYNSIADPSTFVLPLQLMGYSAQYFDAPIIVTALDYESNNQSQGLPISVAYIPPPIFASISGCQGSGTSTLLCVPDSDVVQLQGSGLSIFSRLQSWQFILGNSSAAYTTGMQVVSDSLLQLPLNTSFQYLLQPLHFTGVQMQLSFNFRSYSYVQRTYLNYRVDSGLSLSFTLLPPIVLLEVSTTRFDSGACVRVANTSASTYQFDNCVPEQNQLFLRGYYLFDATAALTAAGKGVYPCTSLFAQSSGNFVYLQLPLIPDDEPGLAWDVIISTASGNVTLPAAIRFTTLPTITSMVPCILYSPDPSVQYYTACTPTSVLTIRGVNFPAGTASVQLTTNQISTAGRNVSLLQPTVVDAHTVTATIPVMDTADARAFYGTYSTVSVTFASIGQLLGPSAYIVNPPDAPVVTAVSGCEVSNGTRAMARCRAGDVLTITGSNLNISLAEPYFSNANRWYDCDPLPQTSSSEAQCRLPYVNPGDSDLQEGVAYPLQWYELRISGPTYSYAFASFISLSFTWDAPPSPAMSAASNVTAIVAGVLVPVLVIAAVVVAWLMYRRAHGMKRTGSGGEAGGDGGRRGDSFSSLEM